MQEKVSIVVCTFNGATYLREQLDSLLAQTYPLYEIIVQDDGSKDATWEILQEYAAKNPVIHLYKNEGKHGINGNFFSALHRATGNFIAVSDQDDVWEPGKIASQMEGIGENAMCGGFSKPFSSDGFPVLWDNRRPCIHLLRLSFLSEIPGHVQLFRRELLDFLPPMDTVPYLYDWQLQFVASAAERLVFLDRVLVNFRRHAEAATATRPVSNHGREGWRTFCFLLKNYGLLHQFAAKRFRYVEQFLKDLQQKSEMFDTESTRLTLQLAQFYQSTGVFNYLRLTLFCMRHHPLLFHAPEKKRWKSILQAAYFPLYSLNYYRGIIR